MPVSLRCNPIAAVLVLALAAPAAGQAMDRDLGLGLGLRSEALFIDVDQVLRTMSPVAYFIMPVGDGMLLEPSVTLTRRHASTQGLSGEQTSTLLTWRVGLSVLFFREQGDAGRTYIGPRLGLGRSSWKSSGLPQTEFSRTDFSGALIAGGEYFVAAGLGLGGEVGIEYRRFGGTEDSPDDWSSMLDTIAELRVRWYLR